jgi:NTE family protein
MSLWVINCRRNSQEARLLYPESGLDAAADRKVYDIVHLIYLARNYEGQSKDYEFSRLSTVEHWRAGYHDARRTLHHAGVLPRSRNHEGVFTFDLAADGRE